VDFLPLKSLLKNVVDNRGKTCPVAETGFPLIATNCVKNSTLFPTLEKVRFVSDATYNNWFRGHPEPNDLIFVLKGAPGQVCLAPEPLNFCIAQDMVALRADESIVYPPYLFAALRSRSVQSAIKNMHVGTMIPHFKKGDFDKLDIPIPNAEVQKEIGDGYLEFCRKIELNRRMNATLEAMAQAIFKDWFVDFGPTRRKADGETDPVKILGGLIPDPMKAKKVAALFPDSVTDDGLPTAWGITSFIDFIQIIGGGTPKTSKEEFWNGPIPWFSVKDTPNGSDCFVFKTEKTITPAGLNGSSAKLIEKGTTIISARGTVGNLAIAGQDMTFNQSCYALKPKTGDAIYFTFLATQRVVQRLKDMAHGSVFSTITRGTFESVDFPNISAHLVEQFESICSPLFTKIRANVEENQTLAETRDYLLPKLMSGEVRVGDAAAEIPANASNVIPMGSDLFDRKALPADKDLERDSAIVAGVISALQKDTEVVGNVKYQKGCYFVYRLMGYSTRDFEQKAAGPYTQFRKITLDLRAIQNILAMCLHETLARQML